MGTLLKFISSSSILGLIDDILSGITTVLIGPLLWGLCDIFFLILDMFETLYKKFAGIEDFMIGKDTVSQDPVLYMMNTSVVQEIFFSILILSLILLIIFTIFAIVKNIYTEKPKPVGEIIRSSMKGLLMYLLVPVATVVCLLVGNIVLRAIDGATKLGGASGMSDMLFMSAAYNANRFRDDDTEYAMKQLQSMLKDGELTPVNYEENKGNDRVQSYVKIMESYGVDVADKEIENTSLIDLEGIASAVDEAYVANVIGGNKWNFFNVMQYYYIIKINLIMVWAGGAFMIFALGKITWGLVARLFKMTAYYAISPALMAMYPIDNGKAVGSWRSEMVKNGTMAYCAIGTLNVVLSILPAFSKLKLFGVGLLDGLAVLFIDIVALASAEKMISTVSSWFGTGDALAEGKAAQADTKKAKEVAGKGAKKASGIFAGIAGGRAAAKDKYGGEGVHSLTSMFGKGAGERWKNTLGRAGGGLMGGLSQTGFAKMRQDTQKNWKDAQQQGKDFHRNMSTLAWNGDDKQAFERKDNGKYQWDRNMWTNPITGNSHKFIGVHRRKNDLTTRAEEYDARAKLNSDNKERARKLAKAEAAAGHELKSDNPADLAILESLGLNDLGAKVLGKEKKDLDTQSSMIGKVAGVAEAQKEKNSTATYAATVQKNVMGTSMDELKKDGLKIEGVSEQFFDRLAMCIKMADRQGLAALGAEANKYGFTAGETAVGTALSTLESTPAYAEEFGESLEAAEKAADTFKQATQKLSDDLKQHPKELAAAIKANLVDTMGDVIDDKNNNFLANYKTASEGVVQSVDQFNKKAATLGREFVKGTASQQEVTKLLEEIAKELKKK